MLALLQLYMVASLLVIKLQYLFQLAPSFELTERKQTRKWTACLNSINPNEDWVEISEWIWHCVQVN